MVEYNWENIFHRRIGWLAIAMLLFLRIPFTIAITYMFPSDRYTGPAIYHVGTYLLTAFLIWWERNDLAIVHLETLSLVIIVLLKPVQTLVLQSLKIDTPLTFPHPVGLLLWIIAIGLVITLWISGYRLPKVELKTWGWLAFGLFIGIGLSALENYNVFQADAMVNSPSPVSLSSIAASTGTAFLYQLGFASVSEEPLFRGFLWGYLRRSGWKEGWIWLAQAAVFMSAHLYFRDALPFEFWVVVPLAGLILGFLAWRSRSIAPGMMAHAAYNAGAYLILLRFLDSFQ